MSINFLWLFWGYRLEAYLTPERGEFWSLLKKVFQKALQAALEEGLCSEETSGICVWER